MSTLFEPDSKNLIIGAGKILFGRFDKGTFTKTDGDRFLGNCPGFTMQRVNETLDHYASTGGLKRKDRSINLQASYDGTITTDDFAMENLSLFTSSRIQGLSVSAVTSKNYAITAKRGAIYQLGQTAANILGDRLISNVVVTRTTPSAVTYVNNVDYEVDLLNGVISILAQGTITTGTVLDVEYDVGASTRRFVTPTFATIEGELRYISANPVGPKYNLFFPRVSIKADGDLSLIGNEFLTMNFAVSALSRTGYQLFYMETQTQAVP